MRMPISVQDMRWDTADPEMGMCQTAKLLEQVPRATDISPQDQSPVSKGVAGA